MKKVRFTKLIYDESFVWRTSWRLFGSCA